MKNKRVVKKKLPTKKDMERLIRNNKIGPEPVDKNQYFIGSHEVTKEVQSAWASMHATRYDEGFSIGLWKGFCWALGIEFVVLMLGAIIWRH